MAEKRRFDPIGLGLAVYLCLVGLFMLAPTIFVVINSFNPAPYAIFPPTGFSLHWYENVLYNVPQFRKGLVNSLVVAVGATALALVMGTLASRALTRHHMVGRETIRSFFFSPVMVPRVVFGCALFLLYIRVSLYGTIHGLIIGHALLGLPFGIAVISASLLNVDPATEEAALDLGANPIRSFIFVTLPQIRVGLLIAGLFAFMESFDQVDVSIFLTRPDNNTLPIEMFVYSANYQDPTLAAVSSLLIGFTILLVLVAIPILRNQEYRRLLERQ